MAKETQGLKWLVGADARDFKRGMAEAQKASRQFKAEAGKAFDQFAAAFGINMGELRKSINTFKASVTTLGGATKAAGASTGIFTKALQLLKVAMIGTGIGALIVALGTLISYFTNTERGARKFRAVLEGFQAIIAVLIDRFSAFGEGVFKIFTGDFKGGWDALKNSMKGIGAEMVAEGKAASQLQRDLDALYDKETELMTVQAERGKEIARLRLEAEDRSKSEAERVKMVQQALALEQKSLEENLAVQRERARIVNEQVGLGESMAEDTRKAAEENARLAELERESLTRQKELFTKTQELTAAQKAKTEAVKEEVQTYKDLRQAQQEQFDAEIEMRKQLLPSIAQQQPGIGNVALAPMTLLTPEQITELQGQADAMKGIVLDLTSEINNAMAGMASGFGEAIGNMIAGTASFADIGSLILGPLADMAIQVGKIAISSGIAISGIKKAFMSMNPAVAIAAGVALVALGTAVKGALSNVAKGGTGAGGGGYSVQPGYDGRGLQTSSNVSATPQAQKIEIIGETTIKKNDIYVAFKAAEAQKKINT